MAEVNLPRQGTINLIKAFEAKAGLEDTDIRGLDVIMAVNEAFIRDAEAGFAYCLNDGGSRLVLSDLYEGHLETAAEHSRSCPSREVFRVDDVALDRINRYLTSQGVVARSHDELVMAAASLVSVFYDHYGAGKDGALHIPAVDPMRPMECRRVHIHLKP